MQVCVQPLCEFVAYEFELFAQISNLTSLTPEAIRLIFPGPRRACPGGFFFGLFYFDFLISSKPDFSV